MLQLDNFLHILFSHRSLTDEEAETAMHQMIDGAESHQVAALLSLLKFRGETVEEVTGMARALDQRALHVSMPYPVMDIVGTGGDQAGTVNISTGSAILAAACGIPIAKHGNRSVSSQSGSADVLEALEIEIEMSPKEIMGCLSETQIAYLFAPVYHPCFKTLRTIRKALKIPTLLNMMGILLNPAKAQYALLGVANPALLELIGQVVIRLGIQKRALVFHGSGLDELSPLGPIQAYHIHEGQMEHLALDPLSFGISRCSLQELKGGDAQTNARLLMDTFSGQPGAIANALILNVGTALWIYGKVNSIMEGIELARQVLQEGKALQVVQKWKAFSKKLKRGGSHELS